MSRIGAFTNRFAGLNIRSGGQGGRDAKGSSSPRSPSRRSEVQITDHQSRVNLLLRNPELFSEFKRRVSETRNFSNVGANFVLHEFLAEIELRGAGDQSRRIAADDMDISSSSSHQMEHGFNNGFGLLNSLRTMTLEPPSPSSPDGSYQQQRSHRSHFDCPVSPGSVQNISPKKTPVSPISATTASTTGSPLSPSERIPDEDIDLVTMDVAARTRGAMLAGLEQPSLL